VIFVLDKVWYGAQNFPRIIEKILAEGEAGDALDALASLESDQYATEGLLAWIHSLEGTTQIQIRSAAISV
jgi:hypothetical protein